MTAANILKEHGYDAVVMQGMRAWQEADLPVETGDGSQTSN